MVNTSSQLSAKMIIPPSRDDAVAWSQHVSKLLGPPIEIDFEKEAATRRALRKRFPPRVIPSDDQYRYLWQHESTKCDTEQTTTKKDDCASFISTRTEQSLECSESCQFSSEPTTLETSSRYVENAHTDVETADVGRNASFVTPMSSKASRVSRTRTGSKKRSNNVTHESSHRRTQMSTNRGGWISRGNFYKDGGVPAIASELSRVDDSMSEEANTSWSNASEIIQRNLSVERNHECPTRNEACDRQIKTPDTTFEKEKNFAQAQFSSPEDNFVAEQSKERKRGLFRPTAKRANQRLKQASIRHMFGSL